MTTSSSIVTPGPNTTCGSIDDVAAELGVASTGTPSPARSASRPPSIARSAQPPLHRRLGAAQLDAVVDAHHLLLAGQAWRARRGPCAAAISTRSVR